MNTSSWQDLPLGTNVDMMKHATLMVCLLNSRNHAESHGNMGLQLNRMESSGGLAKTRRTSDRVVFDGVSRGGCGQTNLGCEIPQPVALSHFPLSL